MHRRAFLAGLSTLFAGCGSLAAGTGSDGAGEATVTPAPVPTATQTPGVGRDRFAGETCETFDDRVHRTLCSHVQEADAGLRLIPERPVAELDDGRLVSPLRFTLEWSAEGPLSVFADSWYLLGEVDGEWSDVDSGVGKDPVQTVQPGEPFFWVLQTTPTYSTNQHVPVITDISPGRYALAVQMVVERTGLYVECLALFDVVRR
jgi:hypothetical protein